MVVRTPSLVYIYISLNCKCTFFTWMRIKVFLLSLSLSTWYQSQRRKPNLFFRFSLVINSGKPSSDRVSLRSPHSLPEPLRTTSSPSDLHHAGNLFRRNFPTTYFPGNDHIFRNAGGWSTHQWKPHWKLASHVPPCAALLLRTVTHVPASDCAWLTFRPLPTPLQAHPAPSCPLAVFPEPCISIFPCFWLSCHSGHLRQGSPSIPEAWVLLLFLSRHVTTFFFSINCTSHSRGFTVFLSPPKSEPILGLSSIQIREYDHQKLDLYLCYL